jgi:hypothetical protein
MQSVPAGDPNLFHSKRRELLKTIESNNFKQLSTGESTSWPTELPDPVDICVTKGIPQDFAVANACYNLFSDHSMSLKTASNLQQ